MESPFFLQSEVTKISRISNLTRVRLESRGLFPKRVKIGARKVAWRKAEISEWLADPEAWVRRNQAASAMLADLVSRNTDERVEFKNGSVLEIATNDADLVRGRSAIAVLGTEACFWRTDEAAASSDEEVVGAALPGMAMPGD
jgi:predicted DNA-binding transcriptional regulator AlpA